MWPSFKLLVGAILLLQVMGCRNLYRDVSHKTSTDYLLYEAETAIDNLKFDRAIRNLDVVLSRKPNHKHALYMNSIAHAGRAGLRVIRIFETLQGSGSANLFSVLADSFELVDDDDLLDFQKSVNYLEQFAPTADDRSSDENFYALFLYLGRIGSTLNRYAYDQNNDLLLANFSSCHTEVDKAAIKTGIPDDDIDVIMTMIPRIIDTVEKISEQGSANLIDVSSLQALGTFDYDPIPCSDDSNDVDCLSVRTIINNGSTGLGLGTGGPFGLEGTVCALVTPP
jgi:hypothetical protein